MRNCLFFRVLRFSSEAEIKPVPDKCLNREHVINWKRGSLNQFREPVSRTSQPLPPPQLWSKGSRRLMPPSGTNFECIPGLQCLLLCHVGPEKWMLKYISQLSIFMHSGAEPTVQINVPGRFSQNSVLLYPNQCIQ